MSKHSFDVISINETKTDFNTTDSEICITGNELFRKDRSKYGGSVALYVKHSCNATRLSKYETGPCFIKNSRKTYTYALLRENLRQF